MGGGGATSGYSYRAAIMMAICAGPIRGVGKVWSGSSQINPVDLNITTITNGDVTPAIWGYLTTHHPAEAIPYPAIAYAASPLLNLDGNGGIPNLSFEVAGFGQLDPTCYMDAMPDYVLSDVLGIAGFPDSSIGDLTSYSAYCRAAGLFISPALTEQVAAADCLQDIARCTNSEYVWSQGRLTLVPYADATITGNGATFTPNITPVYDLTDDDFIVSDASDAPISVSRITTADAYNHVQVEYVDRSQDYNVAIAEAKDQADIEAKGLRTQDPVALHYICDAAVARNVAQLLLQRVLYIRNTYVFRLSWKYCLLEPMDLVTLTDPTLGLDKAPVKITQIDEDEDGLLTVTAEEYPFGVNSHSLYPSQPALGCSADFNGAPGDVNTPLFFEAPYALTASGSGMELWVGISGGDSFGGCDVYASLDGAAYEKLGTFTGKSRQGVLSATLATSATPLDTVNTLSVNLAESSGELTSGTQMDAQSNLTACYVDGEIVSYATATLAGSNAYSLTYLMRGNYSTPIAAHAAGSSFLRLDQAIFKYQYGREWVGRQIMFKLPAFNPYGTAIQSLADVSPYSYTIRGAAIPPPASSFMFSDQRGGLRHFSWTFSDKYGEIQGFQIRFIRGGAGAWDGMQPLHNGYLTASPYETSRLAGGAYVFGICAIGINGSPSNPVYINATLQDPNLTGVLLADYAADDGWPGTLTDCGIDGGVLFPADAATWDTPPATTWGEWTKWVSHPVSSIAYQHTDIDLGTQKSVTPVVVTDAGGAAAVTISSSPDNVTWSDWGAPSPVNARYFRVKVAVAGDFPTLSALNIYLCDSGAVTEKINDLDTSTLTGDHRIGAGDIRIPISKTYTTITSVMVTLQNVGQGSSYVVVDKSVTIGPRIRILNGFKAVDAIIDVTISGV